MRGYVESLGREFPADWSGKVKMVIQLRRRRQCNRRLRVSLAGGPAYVPRRRDARVCVGHAPDLGRFRRFVRAEDPTAAVRGRPLNRLKLGVVTCGFLGLAPFAPGTFGTLGGVAIAWAMRGLDHYLLWTIAVCVVLYAVGRALAPWAESHAGHKDPGFYVLDEVIGFLITVAWVGGPSYLTLVVGFVLFRFFRHLEASAGSATGGDRWRRRNPAR